MDVADVVTGVNDTGALLWALEPVLAKLTVGMSASAMSGGIAPSEVWPALKIN